jgi:hypothetical protein
MHKVKLFYDFIRLWIKYGDREEAWEDSKIINDKTFQKELDKSASRIEKNLEIFLNKSKSPCRFDHNGECLICDCWPEGCAHKRYLDKDYSLESREELEEMFNSNN